MLYPKNKCVNIQTLSSLSHTCSFRFCTPVGRDINLELLASSGVRWRRRPPDTDGGCECIEQAVANSHKRGVLQLRELGVGLAVRRKNNLVSNFVKSLGIGRNLWMNESMPMRFHT
jgi:hypothetical protein